MRVQSNMPFFLLFLLCLPTSQIIYSACVPYATPVGTTVWQILDNIQSIVAGPAVPNIIMTGQTITQPGFYVVAGNSVGVININSDNVYLHLLGRNVGGIAIAPVFPAASVSNVIIIDGYLSGPILGANVTNLWIENINFTFQGSGVISPVGIQLTSCENVYIGRVRGKNFTNLIEFTNTGAIEIDHIIGSATTLILGNGTSHDIFIHDCVGMPGGSGTSSSIDIDVSAPMASVLIEECIIHGGTGGNTYTINADTSDSTVIRNCSALRTAQTGLTGFSNTANGSNLVVENCFSNADSGFSFAGNGVIVRDCTAVGFGSFGFNIINSANSLVKSCVAVLPVTATAVAFSKPAVVGSDFLNDIGAGCITNFANTSAGLIATIITLPTATYWMNASL